MTLRPPPRSVSQRARLDPALLALKKELEENLTKVICRTERNWYVLDRRKGVDDGTNDSWCVAEA